MMEATLPYIVIASGPAGTAKSSLAVSVAISQLMDKKYERIVITRPTISADEDVGFLPGGLEDKMDPWLRPLYDTFYKYYTVDKMKDMIKNKVIDICPVAYLRGRTLENSFIIIDEAQNCSIDQMLMILTRIGPNSKMVITGDPMQHDRKSRYKAGQEKSGLVDLLDRVSFYKLRTSTSTSMLTSCSVADNIDQVVFDDNDVERHPVIKDILAMYDWHN